MNNLELIFDHLNARRSRDLARLESQFDPGVVHQGVLPELVCNNRQEVLENVQRGFSREDFGVDRLERIDAGARVLVGLAGPRFREVPWARSMAKFTSSTPSARGASSGWRTS